VAREAQERAKYTYVIVEIQRGMKQPVVDEAEQRHLEVAREGLHEGAGGGHEAAAA
jgi:hypothetical protein